MYSAKMNYILELIALISLNSSCLAQGEKE